jgi:SAM-dependent methyltransferase
MSANPSASREACLVCGSGNLHHGLKQDEVPVHSVVLHRSRTESLSQARGRIDLACCAACGFVFNAAFDASLQHYQHNYEATQSFSSTFNAFHEQVAREVAAAASGLQGDVLEIGCGQGEFLALLRRHGVKPLTGFDPAFDLTRSAITGHDSITIVDERFDAGAVSRPVAAMVCKMTLEHIARPVAFLAEMADLSRRNDAAPVFVQVPNGEEVFRTLAFWDVYYEHCNYFTRASLTAAMDRAGLEVDELKTGFDEQYLLCRASATGRSAAGTPKAATKGFDDFCANVATAISQWQQWAKHAKVDGRVALWGGGSKAVAFLSAPGMADCIHAAIDINPRKAGTFLAGSGVAVVTPQQAAFMDLSHVLLLNPAYSNEVSQMMHERGISAKLTVLANGVCDGGQP